MNKFVALCVAAISCACPSAADTTLDFAGESRPEAFDELNKEMRSGKGKEVRR